MVDVYHQQLPSLPDDDFEVIQASLSPYDMSILPQENSPTASGGHMATQTAGQNELLTAQLAAAIERCASMRMSLSNNRILIDRLTHQHKKWTSEADQCHQAKAELAKLRNRQEEWQQTAEDYMKLKNQYNLLANTRERLESEKADLLAKLNSNQQAVPQQDEVKRTEDCQALKDQYALLASANERLESENASLLDRLHSQQQLQQDAALSVNRDSRPTDQAVLEAELLQLKLNASKLDSELQEANSKLSNITAAKDILEQRLHESSHKNRIMEEEMQQVKQQIGMLENELLEEKAKFSSAEQTHRNELEDLRQNSTVRELEDLRRDLYTCLKREQELSDHYNDSDQTINEIINDAEKSKRELQDELAAVKRERQSLFDSLDGTSQRLQDVTHKEMDRAEEVKSLTARLTEAETAHRQELLEMTQRHLAETNLTRQASHRLELSLRAVERDLKSSAAEVEQLKARIDELTRENAESARTVNEVLTQAESDKRGMQTELRTLKDELQRKISAHSDVVQSVETLRRHSVESQQARAALERQLRESNAKCEESVSFANEVRDKLHSEMARAHELEAQLTGLRFEHNSVRSNYVGMETRVNECLSMEHTLQSRAVSAEDRVRSLELALDNYRREFDNEQKDKLALLAEKNSLADQLQKVRNFLQPPSQ